MARPKCDKCGRELEETFLGKIMGTIMKVGGKTKAICRDCQKKEKPAKQAKQIKNIKVASASPLRKYRIPIKVEVNNKTAFDATLTFAWRFIHRKRRKAVAKVKIADGMRVESSLMPKAL